MPEAPFDAASRLIRRADLVACTLAFIDCKLPGSAAKENYSIIGAGVTQSDDQVVNLAEPHGFAIGAAAMPHGVTNNLHIHYTAEVFLIFKGEWLFRWGVDGQDGEFVGAEGDVLSMPTWMFRGFTNIGGDNGWIFTALGRDVNGGVIWDPKIVRSAAEQGLFLRRDNVLVDTENGDPRPAEEDLVAPLGEDAIAGLRRVSQAEMRARITTAQECVWSEAALLGGLGGRAAMAALIGPGMSEDRNGAAKVMNPHGFSVEWLKIAPGQSVGPFRISPKQVLILKSGALRIDLEGAANAPVDMGPWDTFATPAGLWRSFHNPGAEPAIAIVVTGGDERAIIEWAPDVIGAARALGYGRDPNGYIAPRALLPYLNPADAGLMVS